MKDVRYRLQAVRVFTSDLRRAVEFYSEGLGMEPDVVNDSEGFAVFPAGDAMLLLESVDLTDAEDAGLVGRFVGASLAVDDIQRVYESLSAKGIRFSYPPRKQDWGGVLTHFHDPDDNVLTLVEWNA